MSVIAYIGIGSNLGQPQENCKVAIDHITKLFKTRLTQCSSLYETEPIGSIEQSWYINAVAEIETDLSANDLLDALLQIENQMGRIRREKWGPRMIDLDLLFYGDQIIQSKNVLVPHPEIQNRNFVLGPMNEINPNYYHPVQKKRIHELLTELQEKSVIRRLDKSV